MSQFEFVNQLCIKGSCLLMKRSHFEHNGKETELSN